jgi:hypothetical protein
MNKKTENGLQKSSSKIGIANIPIDRTAPATTNKPLVIEVMSRCNLESDDDRILFVLLLDNFSVTQLELYKGFFSAYADHMTPQTGIEFKHIYKHIKDRRNYFGDDPNATGRRPVKEFNPEDYLR